MTPPAPEPADRARERPLAPARGAHQHPESDSPADPLDRPSGDEPFCEPDPSQGLDPSADGPGTEHQYVPVRRGGVDSEGKLRSGKLAGLSMAAAIWVLSWPVVLESFLNSLVGLTDTVLAANLENGEPATDAIGGASYFMWFIGLAIMALGVGATALVSRSVGKGRTAVANTVVGQCVTLGVIIGLLVGSTIAALSGHIADWLSLSEEATVLFRRYLFIISIGAPFQAVLFTLIACARGAGDSKRPLLAMTVRNLVNIVVSYLLCGVALELPGFLGGGTLENPSPVALGVAGIAIGTVVGDIAGMLIVVGMARSGIWGIRLRARRLKLHLVTVWRLQRQGVPNFFETLGLWVGNFAVLMVVGQLGGGIIGSHIIAIRIEAFSFMPGFAMGVAAATLAGQYLGAGRPDLAKAAVIKCMLIAALVMAAFGAVFMYVPNTLVGWLSSQPAHRAAAPIAVAMSGLVQIPFAMAIVFRGAMRGAGDVRAAFIITWTMTYAVRLPLVYLLSGIAIPLAPALAETLQALGVAVVTTDSGGSALANPFWAVWKPPTPEWGLWAVWAAMMFELSLRGLIFSLRFCQGGWLKKAV